MYDDRYVRELLKDAVTLLKANGVKSPLTIERIEHYLEVEQNKPVISPCPDCGSRTTSIGSQRLKMCSCGWKDENWTLNNKQKPLYG